MKVTAYRHTDEAGKTWDLVYDTDDVEAFETPYDVHELPPQPGDTTIRRELGQAHLHLHFHRDKRPTWVPAEKDGDN